MKHLLKTLRCAGALIACLAAPCWAADDATPSTSADRCVVHVWPAERLGSLGEGAMWNHVEGQALRGLKDYALLTPERQVAILNASKAMQFWTDNTQSQIVVHNEPPPRRPLGAPPARRSDNDGKCVRELVISKIFFVYSGFGDKHLRALVTLEDYGTDAAPIRRYSSWGDAELPSFPPKHPEENDDAVKRLEASFDWAWSGFTAHALQALQKPASSK